MLHCSIVFEERAAAAVRAGLYSISSARFVQAPSSMPISVKKICPYEAHIVQPDFKLRTFYILVETVLSYGCQIWGPEIIVGLQPLRQAHNH